MNELLRLKSKIRRGDASFSEMQRYRQLLVIQSDPITSYHLKIIVPREHRSLSPDNSVSPHQDTTVGAGGKRIYAPVPIGAWEQERFKRQKVTPPPLEVTDASSKKHPPLVGILRRSKIPSPQTTHDQERSSSPILEPHIILAALKHPHSELMQRHVGAFTSPSLTARVSAFEELKRREVLASQLCHQKYSSPILAAAAPSLSPPLRSLYDDEACLRRLAGMRSTTAMLAQTLPPSVKYEALKSKTNMSAAHILRRFGNPHRRVVHQMLREQHQRILMDMRKVRSTPASVPLPGASNLV
jgi:hypothetical protein